MLLKIKTPLHYYINSCYEIIFYDDDSCEKDVYTVIIYQQSKFFIIICIEK